ncbi:hypothetical protein M9Y10_039696 [Tritrichomonas musculus]|uniref:Ricin B lectin domain-containing protein n=1 Tax=Tritrichomonas musculus TaxID=1915356 RepID=A0ABR2GQY0_9EUKA
MEYYIVSYGEEHLCLDIQNNSKKRMAKIIATRFHGHPSQKWRIQGDLIYSVHSDLVLDIKFGEGCYKSIIQWPPHNGSNQTWTFYDDGSIRSPKGYCIQINKENYIETGNFYGGNYQKWKLIRCDEIDLKNVTINIFNLSINQSKTNMLSLH